MLNTKHLQYGAAAIALGCALGMTANAGAQIVESDSMAITVLMESSFDLTESQDMHFGMLSVSTTDANGVNPTIVLSTGGVVSVGTTDANNFFFIVNNALEDQGMYTIANAAPSEAITITIPNGGVVDPILTNGNALTVIDIALQETAPNANASPGNANPNASNDATITLTTETDGTAAFSIGATLEAAAGTVYGDGQYDGSMVVNANY